MSNPDTQSNEDKRICIVLGCHRNYYKGGYCEPHYDKTVEQELDFVALGNAMGYKNPMYLPQELKNCIGAALKFVKADRLRTAKEARIDERKLVIQRMKDEVPLIREADALTADGINGYTSAIRDVELDTKERIATLQENTDEA